MFLSKLGIRVKCTVVGDYINTTKMTFDFNFDLYQAVSMDTHKQISQEKLSIKKAFFKLVKAC